MHHQPSITHADKVMHRLAECVKTIQGMTGKARNSKAAQDLQRIIDAAQAHVQSNPHRFKETITPDHFCNTQRVPRVNAPASMPIPPTNDNRQITQSMQSQAPIPRMPSVIPTVKPISAPCVVTTTKSNRKPTTFIAESSKRECQCKQRASRLHNAVPPTSPTTRIGAWAQVATVATQAVPPSANTRSRMRHSGVPPPTRQTGHAAAVMKQQQQQRELVRLTRRITRLENEVHLAMAVMDRDTGKHLNYRQLMNSPKYKKHGACQQPPNLGDWQMAFEGASKTPPTLSSSSPNTRYRQTAEKTSHTGNSYVRSDPKRQNPTKCNSW
jgi:hypothetical protein